MDWVYVIFATLQVFQHGLSYECDSNPTCEIWLSVEEKLTMTWGKIRVYAKNSHLYRFDEDWRNATSKVNTDEVIVMDGIERAVIAVNNSIPGPPIIAYEGQELVVHVKNHLLSDAITIHWHGLHQRGSPFMDGVAYVTQCPIEAGQTFTYRFQAYPRGTFWYHSHIGGQRVDGLFGALIIKPKAKANSNTINDVIMHIGDWFHSRGSELHTKMIHGNFKSKPGFIHPKTLDGVYFAPATYKSSHIEGRGRYWDSNTENWTETPLKNYYVEKGQQYRFRVIHPGTIFPLRVSIDDHLLEIIALDGYDVVPAFFESFIINPGERFDFILTANQSKHEYWIRVESMETDFTNHYVRGILRYDSGSTNDPTTQRMNCTQAIPCRVLNCQFSYYPKHMHTKCTRVDQLKAADTKEAKPSFDKDSIQLFQNWVQMGGGMGVNGILFEHPGVSSLTQPEEIRMDLNCDVANCGPGKICSCQHEIDIPYNKTIQMIWTNHGKGATRHHPIHLHGHSFYVLKLAYGVYNETTGLQIFDNSDINCSPSGLCNDPSFTDRSWHGDNIPGLNLINPPQKDTLMIPTGAYAVVRFRSDNPGKWFVHCHIEFHAMQGMSMILNEAKEQHISPPHGFPICSDFNYDSSLDKAYIRKDLIRYEDCKENLMFIVAVVIGALLVLENCCLLLLKCFRKYSSAGSLKTKYETKVHFKNKKCGGEGNTQKTVL